MMMITCKLRYTSRLESYNYVYISGYSIYWQKRIQNNDAQIITSIQIICRNKLFYLNRQRAANRFI